MRVWHRTNTFPPLLERGDEARATRSRCGAYPRLRDPSRRSLRHHNLNSRRGVLIAPQRGANRPPLRPLFHMACALRLRHPARA